MEIWDAYNANFEKIEGVTLIRGEEASIPKGTYHLVVDILVRHADGTYLLMKRDPRKSHPNMWEASAGGSALKGETPLQAAFRELKEETGVETKELTEINREVMDSTHSVYVEYLCVTDCDKDSITLQEGETVDYKWVPADEIINMSKEEMISRRAQAYLRSQKE